MKLPSLQAGRTYRVVTDTFRGYRRALKIADGECYDETNLTGDYYPLLASRGKRVKFALGTERGACLLGGDSLLWIDNGLLYSGGTVLSPPTLVSPLQTLSDAVGRKMVRMGAYVVIFPDRVYVNLANPTDYGSLDAKLQGLFAVSYTPCDVDGTPYTLTATSSTAPSSPSDGDYWLDTGARMLKQYSSSDTKWIEVETVYTKVTILSQAYNIIDPDDDEPGDDEPGSDEPGDVEPGDDEPGDVEPGEITPVSSSTFVQPFVGDLRTLFKAGDCVEISGLDQDGLNGSKVLGPVGESSFVVIGLGSGSSDGASAITIERSAPTMDFVFECQNRLWGCYYGTVGGNQVNEIYCSALGDFKNWRKYQGLSTDSWAASVGGGGNWTGAINYMGRPTFFKEDRVYTVTVSASGAHRVDETPCRGVQEGSADSMCIVGETLYYKSPTDVCAWQGGFPVSVSEALGDVRYFNAVAGSSGKKLFLSMLEAEGWRHHSHLFVLDTARGIWSREDGLRALAFARTGEDLWCLAPSGSTGAALWCLTQSAGPWYMESGVLLSGQDAQPESSVAWSMETGVLYYEYPDKKYVSRYDIRLQMAASTTATVSLEYDSSGTWVLSGQISHSGTAPASGLVLKTVTLPIRPRRCDHLRMKISGTGMVKILSIARVLEIGSDV